MLLGGEVAEGAVVDDRAEVVDDVEVEDGALAVGEVPGDPAGVWRARTASMAPGTESYRALTTPDALKSSRGVWPSWRVSRAVPPSTTLMSRS